MNLPACLRTLARFEESLAGLYMGFAEQFAGDSDAAFVFYKLSLDEVAHSRMIEFQRRLLRKGAGPLDEATMDLSPIENRQAKVDRTRAAARPLMLTQAVELALDLESTAAEVHAAQAMKQADPGLAQLLDNLSRADRTHFENLVSFATSRGFSIPDELQKLLAP